MFSSTNQACRAKPTAKEEGHVAGDVHFDKHAVDVQVEGVGGVLGLWGGLIVGSCLRSFAKDAPFLYLDGQDREGGVRHGRKQGRDHYHPPFRPEEGGLECTVAKEHPGRVRVKG